MGIITTIFHNCYHNLFCTFIQILQKCDSEGQGHSISPDMPRCTAKTECQQREIFSPDSH